jgi:hypothetical protein
MNIDLDVIIKIVRSKILCHFRARSCEEVKESKAGHNLSCGFAKGMRGGHRIIVGPKVV